MMRQFELVERVKSYDQNADEALLNRAYVYAMKAHGSQKRASGDPYFSHPLEVAAILTNLKLDDATIVTALLHDTIEDTDSTREELDELFGEEIGTLVEGVTKIEQLNLASKKAAQAENLRKLLIAISSDVRVLLVKMADRLHNMRTLHYVRPEKRIRIAEETMDIYAPLAARMGMQEIREELEDLSFQALNPDARDAIIAHLEETKPARAALIPGIVALIKEKLQEHGINAEIKWREKRPFSIWRKMERRSISLEQLSDILGFRIIVNSVDECYLALGVVHQNWPMVPERFKDHISLPKENDYRTIHTTVIDSQGHRIELQIRTWEMDEVAERGIAAHALYKDNADAGAVPLSRESNAYRWLRGMVERLSVGATPEEFLEHTKLELFQDQVFCFTPKGRLIVLPQRATPIDFAYAVHTDVGNKCVGSKINGRHAPLTTRLRNGDEVEIFTSEAQVPPAAWEKIAITAKARSAIKRANREAMRAQYVSLGEEILKRAFKREGVAYSEDAIVGILPRLARAEVQDVAEAIGRGELSSETVIAALSGDSGARSQPEEPKKRFGRRAEGKGWFGLGKAMGVKLNLLDSGRRKTDAGSVLPVRGLGHSDMPVRFADKCSALPGERIVGILIPGEGVVIYPIDSRELEKYSRDTDNWIDVAWDINEENPERFPAALRVTVMNEPGALGQITQAIGANDGNIENIHFTDRAPDFFKMNIEISVYDIKHLNKILSVIARLQPVSNVRRLTCDDFLEPSKN